MKKSPFQIVLLVTAAKERKLKVSTYRDHNSTRREVSKLWTEQRVSHLESSMLKELIVEMTYLVYFNKGKISRYLKP